MPLNNFRWPDLDPGLPSEIEHCEQADGSHNDAPAVLANQLVCHFTQRVQARRIAIRSLEPRLVEYPREVFKAAVLANAAAIVVGHNHPSGDVNPSSEDKAVLARLKDAGELMGIRVLDSVIVGPESRFYAASIDKVLTLADVSPTGNQSGPSQSNCSLNKESGLERICLGLLQDIGEVLERQGEGWWAETVASGTRHRSVAEKALGRDPYCSADGEQQRHTKP